MKRFTLNVPSNPLSWVKEIGFSHGLEDFERRKLGVFNQLNLLGICTGLALTILGAFDGKDLPLIATIVAFSPVVISSIVLVLNYYRRYEKARMVYFSLYPFITALVYKAGMDVGVELFFILYAILAVFYLQNFRNAIISFASISIFYLLSYVIPNEFSFQLKEEFFGFYLFNHILALVLLFFTVFRIKKENHSYQISIIEKSRAVHKRNLEIEEQRRVIQKKAEELTKMDMLKNKLFSIVAHDLKGPIYAQRNLLKMMHTYNVPAEDIKEALPDLLNDMNQTINLMDNLLYWSKMQLESQDAKIKPINLAMLIENIFQLHRLQAEAKDILLQADIETDDMSYGDKEMIHLVIRNLVSNAIKFTPKGGRILARLYEQDEQIHLQIRDSGVGMSEETLKKLTANEFYSTAGTAKESGTGLGLMLCRDYLVCNHSSLQITSTVGKGSCFSFSLPLVNDKVMDEVDK